MQQDQLKALLGTHGRACLDLADSLHPNGMPLTPVEKRLVRIATLPAMQESFEVGVAVYLLSGDATVLVDRLADAFFEG